jgi:hypothetical protein
MGIAVVLYQIDKKESEVLQNKSNELDTQVDVAH